MDTITLRATRTSIATLVAMLIVAITLMLIATILATSFRPPSVNLRGDNRGKALPRGTIIAPHGPA
jgi:hypothetical protein